MIICNIIRSPKDVPSVEIDLKSPLTFCLFTNLGLLFVDQLRRKVYEAIVAFSSEQTFQIVNVLKDVSLLPSVSSANRVEVSTTRGKVSGKLFKTCTHKVEYYGFMGIPYAAPPVKKFRFLPPQPVKPWNDTLDNTLEKPACIQFNNNIKKGQPFGQYGREDCLYLDVYSPDTEGKKYPVLVFLHHEHFINSYNKTRDYGPDFFIEEKLVVVTIAHRLSIFGFLTLEDDTLPSNAGLKDIVKGLEWLQDNIEYFGGDPSKVTLLGSQGGAAAVDLLLNSKANHLFHSVILQSGTTWTSRYLQENAGERALKLAEVLEIPFSNSQKFLEEVQRVSPENLFKRQFDALPKDYFKEEQKQLLPFGPVVEKEGGLITGYQDDLKKIDVPVMIGSNSLEGLEAAFQYLIEPRYLSFVEKDFPFQLPRRVRFRFNPLNSAFYEAVEEIKAFYFSKGKISRLDEFVTYLGDVLTAYAVDHTASFYANISTKKVFYYNFDYSGKFNENKRNLLKLSSIKTDFKGAATGDELCYLFQCPDLLSEYVKGNRSRSTDIAMQKKVVRMWANFVKFGNPTPDGDSVLDGVAWKPYDVDAKEYLHIGKYVKMRRNLNQDRFDFWNRFMEKWEREAKNGVISKRTLRSLDEL